MAAVTVLALVYVLPKEISFSYSFEKGKAWQHNDLLAPFDFPVQRSPDEMDADRKKAMERFFPCFRIDSAALLQAVDGLKRDLNDQAFSQKVKAKNLNSLKDTLITRLEEIYRRGLIAPFDNSQFNNIQQIALIGPRNTPDIRPYQDFFSLQQAYDYCISGLPASQAKIIAPVIEKNLAYSVLFDSLLTANLREELVAEVMTTDGMVQKGELLIVQGGIVTPEKFRILQSLKQELESSASSSLQQTLIVFGQLIIIALLIGLYLAFLYNFKREVYLDNRRLLLLLSNMLLTAILFSFANNSNIPTLYYLPLCILPIVTRVFYDSVTAVITHLTTVLILSFFASESTEFIMLQSISGLAAVYSLISIRKRSRFFATAFVIFLSYALAIIGWYMLRSGDISQLKIQYLTIFAINALLTLLASPLIYIYEKLFGLVSEVTLLELSDSNSPLLKELSFKAPGTFQHSLQVANLAEAAIYEIGGNTLLARVGALYHDIGKMRLPIYFIENQANGLNPHDELPYEESAGIIIAHVIEGIRLARQNKIPEIIIDFIRTHHGDQRVEYFYHSFLRNFPDRPIQEDKFRYPGPRPFSKETAVLMMADSVEAASRSLKVYDETSISTLVDRIIDKQMENGQFENAAITLKDIAKTRQIFKRMLNNIYHVRIEYPKAL